MLIAGIGSRETPPDILNQMEMLGSFVAECGGVVRSGHAPGADQAFERGAGEFCEVYLPWSGFEGPLRTRRVFVLDSCPEIARTLAYQSVDRYHPAPDRLTSGARKLIARNYLQIMGANGVAVDMVICWTPSVENPGGTGQGIRIAKDNGVPVFDLREVDFDDVLDALETLCFPIP